jgi:predicted secreted protein
MAVSNAIAGVGSSFLRERDASSGTFLAIAEVGSITGPNLSRGTIDVTSLDSTDGYREFIGSFRDGGELTFEMNFTRDGYIFMKDDLESSTKVNYQIILTDTGETAFDFLGFVTALGLAVPLDDKVSSSVTIKISGPVTVSS